MSEGRVRILSVDGGGIRGVIPATVLVDLERRAKRPVAELFDLVAGTSTGGLIALALTRRGDGDRPRWSAADVLDLYLREGPRIFSRSLWRRIESVGGIADEKYSNAALREVLDTFLGDARLADALGDVLVCAYDIERRDPFFFKSARAREDRDRDYAIADAALATASAPTYFEPVRVRSATGTQSALIDGGVFAVNPAMCAYAEARRDGAAPEVTLVSLGTGQLTRPIPYEEAKDWGLLEWARPLVDVVFDGSSDVVDYQATQLLGAQFHRLQVTLDTGSDDLDDASASNLRLLQEKGAQVVAEHDAELDRLVAELTR